jgi:hypothetical protein
LIYNKVDLSIGTGWLYYAQNLKFTMETEKIHIERVTETIKTDSLIPPLPYFGNIHLPQKAHHRNKKPIENTHL